MSNIAALIALDPSKGELTQDEIRALIMTTTKIGPLQTKLS
jgi:hypothetical protein